MVKKVKTKRTNKKKAIVGKHPITGKPETQEERDSRLRSVDYPRVNYAYSDKVLDHYENPRNVGSFDKNDKHVQQYGAMW